MGRRGLMAHLFDIALLQLCLHRSSAVTNPATTGTCLEGKCPSQGQSQIQITSHVPPTGSIQTTERSGEEFQLWQKVCSCQPAPIPGSAHNNSGSFFVNFNQSAYVGWEFSSYYDAFPGHRQIKVEDNVTNETTDWTRCYVNKSTNESIRCFNMHEDLYNTSKPVCELMCRRTVRCPCMVTEACRCLLASCRGCGFCNSTQKIKGSNGYINFGPLNGYGPEYDPDPTGLLSAKHQCEQYTLSDIGRDLTQEDIDKANCKSKVDENRKEAPFCDGYIRGDPWLYGTYLRREDTNENETNEGP